MHKTRVRINTIGVPDGGGIACRNFSANLCPPSHNELGERKPQRCIVSSRLKQRRQTRGCAKHFCTCCVFPAPFAFGFGSPGYDYDYYYYDDSCYQLGRVPTRYGWRWRRVWVCAY